MRLIYNEINLIGMFTVLYIVGIHLISIPVGLGEGRGVTVKKRSYPRLESVVTLDLDLAFQPSPFVVHRNETSTIQLVETRRVYPYTLYDCGARIGKLEKKA